MVKFKNIFGCVANFKAYRLDTMTQTFCMGIPFCLTFEYCLCPVNSQYLIGRLVSMSGTHCHSGYVLLIHAKPALLSIPFARYDEFSAHLYVYCAPVISNTFDASRNL